MQIVRKREAPAKKAFGTVREYEKRVKASTTARRLTPTRGTTRDVKRSTLTQ